MSRNSFHFDAKRSGQHAPATNDASNALCVRQTAPELRLTTAERSTSLDAETKDFVCRRPTNGQTTANFRERRSAVIESKREY